MPSSQSAQQINFSQSQTSTLNSGGIGLGGNILPHSQSAHQIGSGSGGGVIGGQQIQIAPLTQHQQALQQQLQQVFAINNHGKCII